jgi:hypothetical protein
LLELAMHIFRPRRLVPRTLFALLVGLAVQSGVARAGIVLVQGQLANVGQFVESPLNGQPFDLPPFQNETNFNGPYTGGLTLTNSYTDGNIALSGTSHSAVDIGYNGPSGAHITQTGGSDAHAAALTLGWGGSAQLVYGSSFVFTVDVPTEYHFNADAVADAVTQGSLVVYGTNNAIFTWNGVQDPTTSIAGDLPPGTYQLFFFGYSFARTFGDPTHPVSDTDFGEQTLDLSTTAPEPASLTLGVVGLAGLGIAAGRRRLRGGV